MADNSPPKVATGVPGLDDILGGGLPKGRIYLVEGDPGTGKTTLGLQFLLEGVRRGERTLYVTLTETADELRAVAESHGWSLDGMSLCEVRPNGESGTPEADYTILHPGEVELGEITKAIADEVKLGPARVVLDSVTELRLLARPTDSCRASGRRTRRRRPRSTEGPRPRRAGAVRHPARAGFESDSEPGAGRWRIEPLPRDVNPTLA
jgi:KaiC/GvpD/RAD55 family RecA-like ATPase